MDCYTARIVLVSGTLSSNVCPIYTEFRGTERRLVRRCVFSMVLGGGDALIWKVTRKRSKLQASSWMLEGIEGM